MILTGKLQEICQCSGLNPQVMVLSWLAPLCFNQVWTKKVFISNSVFNKDMDKKQQLVFDLTTFFFPKKATYILCLLQEVTRTIKYFFLLIFLVFTLLPQIQKFWKLMLFSFRKRRSNISKWNEEKFQRAKLLSHIMQNKILNSIVMFNFEHLSNKIKFWYNFVYLIIMGLYCELFVYFIYANRNWIKIMT